MERIRGCFVDEVLGCVLVSSKNRSNQRIRTPGTTQMHPRVTLFHALLHRRALRWLVILIWSRCVLAGIMFLLCFGESPVHEVNANRSFSTARPRGFTLPDRTSPTANTPEDWSPASGEPRSGQSGLTRWAPASPSRSRPWRALSSMATQPRRPCGSRGCPCHHEVTGWIW